MRRSTSRRSTTASRTEPGRAAGRGVEVYLLPAVVGGGRGDVEEVLAVGRALARRRHRVLIYRSRPLAVLEDPSFDRTGIRQVRRLAPRAGRAVTISSQFGVTAADGRDEPLGRPGPWALERAEIDRAYGPGCVLHVSLEEFARGRPSAELAEERWRESGTTARARRSGRNGAKARAEAAEFRRLFRKFRDLDRPDLLAIFPTLRPSRRFAEEFPETVQAGPVWPEPLRRRAAPARRGPLHVLWYASPSTSERLAPRLLAGLRGSEHRVVLRVRSSRPMILASTPRVRIVLPPARSSEGWRREWARTDLAIVTGTRSLLEAIEWGVPFLYFNGVIGRGRSARRHRPEKILALLALLRSSAVPSWVRRDLADFSRLRAVEPVVRRWLDEPRVLGPEVRRAIRRRFRPPFADAGALVAEVIERFGTSDGTAADLVRAVRRESRRPVSKV